MKRIDIILRRLRLRFCLDISILRIHAQEIHYKNTLVREVFSLIKLKMHELYKNIK